MDPLDVLCSSSRLGAARCAALASHAEHLDESEHIKWRQQAIQWLQVDPRSLAEFARDRLRFGTRSCEESYSCAGNPIPTWRYCAIRRAIDKLPAEEAAQCRDLWSELDAAINGGLSAK